MTTTTHQLIRYFLSIVIAIAWMGCIDDKVTDEDTLPEDKVRLQLQTNAGDYALPAASRTGAGNPDYLADDPWVFVFRGNSNATAVFYEAIQARKEGTKTYVILTKYASDCRILVIANPPTEFYNGTTNLAFNRTNLETQLAGKKLSEAESILQVHPQLDSPQTTVPYAAGQYIPMSGVLGVSLIDKTTVIEESLADFKLERMVARIVVKSTASNFILKSATVMNAPRRGKIYCDGATLLDNTGSLTLYNDPPHDIEYIAEAALTAPYSTAANPLYVYESRAAEKTAIIIKGAYNGVDGYYKIFVTNAAGTPIDILRNKAFLVDIIDAGAGYLSLADAITAPASNIRTTIQVTDDHPYDMVSNGQYYLGVSNSELVVYDNAALTNILAFTVTTNAYNDLPGLEMITNSIVSDHASLVVASPSPAKATLAAAANSSGVTTEVRVNMTAAFTVGVSHEITVKLGNLVRKVKVTRRAPINAGGIQEIDGSYVSAVVASSGTGNWFALSDDGITPATSNIIHSTPNKVYVMADHNLTLINGGAAPANRTGAEFYLVRTDDNGGGRIKALITQAGGVSTVIPNSYVGAFWRNNQKGERLIKITGLTSSYTGAWSAKVVSGKEWIILDRESSDDLNVPYAADGSDPMVDMLTTANDDYYSLPSSTATTSVSQSSTPSNTIQFRIGLKERLAAGAEPRYGLVILSYNNNTKFQPIFIRQGEKPALLFLNYNAQDAYNGTTQRTQSVKFSPFNLSDPKRFVGSTVASEHTQLPDNNYTAEQHFTDYPSQGGYQFQWAGERRAFHPINQPNGGYSGFPGATSGYWSTAYETCPSGSGYRHPTDGATNTSVGTNPPIAQSEIRQTLWMNPPEGEAGDETNANWGYYADGFFDRRTIVTPPGAGARAASCVSYHTSTLALNTSVAFMGTVFFNPQTLASLFLPAAGTRDYLTRLHQMGNVIMITTSSIHGGAWLTHIGPDYTTHMIRDASASIYTWSVRCLKI